MDKKIKLWDADGIKKYELEEPEVVFALCEWNGYLVSGLEANKMQVSPKSDLSFLKESKGQIRIWDVKEQNVTTLVTKGGVRSLAVTGSHLCSGSGHGLICIWSLPGTLVVKIRSAHDAAIRCLSVMSQNGEDLLISAGRDGKIRVWKDFTVPGKGYKKAAEMTFQSETRPHIHALTIWKGRIFSAHSLVFRNKKKLPIPFKKKKKEKQPGGLIAVWELSCRSLVDILEMHEDAITSLCVYNDHLWSASEDQRVLGWKGKLWS
jgi:WD40 repeat protein